MDDTGPILELLERRKNRLIRSILGSKERLYPDDDDGVFRKIVLDEVNDFYGEVEDIIFSVQHGKTVVVNQLFLDKLDELSERVASATGAY